MATSKSIMKPVVKKVFLKIHGLLGLATGLVVFIVSITGCCWVFKEEVKGVLNPEAPISMMQKPVVLPTMAKAIAGGVFPGKGMHGVIYGKENAPIEVVFYESEPAFYRSVFLHPYTGQVMKTTDHLSGFFAFVLRGHLRLWLPESIGPQVVTISVLLFLLILVSGLVLWFPKNKKAWKQRLRFLWKPHTGWRRKNFDLHAITGFYVYLLAFTLAFTGCVMGFDWFYYLTYKAAGGEKDPQFIIVPSTSVAKTGEEDFSLPPMDRLLTPLRNENQGAQSFELHFPPTDSSSIYVEVAYQQGIHYNQDYRFFDQNTLEELRTTSIYGKYGEAGFADKLIRMNYDIHIGSIGGIFGKVLAFLASLVSASLPVTGFLLWWGRRKKNKNRRKGKKQGHRPPVIKQGHRKKKSEPATLTA